MFVLGCSAGLLMVVVGLFLWYESFQIVMLERKESSVIALSGC